MGRVLLVFRVPSWLVPLWMGVDILDGLGGGGDLACVVYSDLVLNNQEYCRVT